MGLGKTFTGAEKMKQLGLAANLLICQKSKISDWIYHFETYYPEYDVLDLTNGKEIVFPNTKRFVAIINYELSFRRKALTNLENFTLILDESSMIQNDSAKRTKFVQKLKYQYLILLSGTPTGGKYENLYSQLKMLGMKLSKTSYYEKFIKYFVADNCGIPYKIITGYKNVDELKQLMRDLGCNFMKTENIIDLPEQIFTKLYCDPIPQYKHFKKHKVVHIGDDTIIGDTTLTAMLSERKLCGYYNKNKLVAFSDLLSSSNERFIVFYNFNAELKEIEEICDSLDKPTSIVNGEEKDLKCFEEFENTVLIVQYQAGAMGLNLQMANKIVYFTPPLSSELFEQSKKRIHRIGQSKTCFYYKLITKKSIEEKIYKTLDMRKDYTERLFENERY